MVTTKRFIMTLALVGIGGTLSTAHGAAITVPIGLSPGATYRIVFITSTARDGTSTDIDIYNDFVTTAADLDAGLLSLGTTWKALASTATTNVLANTGLSALDTTTPFFNTRGNRIATGVTVGGSGLFGGGSTTHLSTLFTETGSAPPINAALTGTAPDGTTSTSPLGGSSVMYGHPQKTTFEWIAESPLDNTYVGLYYGISGDLTVPGTPTPDPEPATIALTGLGAALAFAFSKVRKARN